MIGDRFRVLHSGEFSTTPHGLRYAFADVVSMETQSYIGQDYIGGLESRCTIGLHFPYCNKAIAFQRRGLQAPNCE